jgi:hypothetical protein
VKSLHDFLSELVSLLEAARIPYMVTGSIASTYYGRPRATQDIDLVIDPESRALHSFVRAALDGGYYVDERDAAEALERRGMFNVIDAGSGYKLDLIVRKDRPYSVEEFARRRLKSLPGARISIVSPEDAILSKLEWAREGQSERQLQDALGIMVAQGERLDTHYLRKWAAGLGVTGLLEKLLQQARRSGG